MKNFTSHSAADVTHHSVPTSTSISPLGNLQMKELQPTTGTQGTLSESAKLHNAQQLKRSNIQNIEASISVELLPSEVHHHKDVTVDQDVDLRISVSGSLYDNIEQVHGLGETSNPLHTVLLDFQHSQETAITCYYRHCFRHRPAFALGTNSQVQPSLVSRAASEHDLTIVGLDSSSDLGSANGTSFNDVLSANLSIYSPYHLYIQHLDRLEHNWVGEPVAVDYGRTVMSSELLEALETL